MRSLLNEQKQLLFDYCLGLTSDTENIKAEELIALSQEAAEIHKKLKVALAPLECMQPELCPDNLTEKTIRRINKHVDISHKLLIPEQIPIVATKANILRNLSKIFVRAAAILVIAAILIPPLSHGRSLYRRHICEGRLGSISQNIDQYCNDYDGEFPTVDTNEGEPWYKVGYQGKENHSNTRNLFLLLKHGYSDDSKIFMCPGRKQNSLTAFDISEVQEYNDFPTRKHITYSFRIICNPPIKKSMLRGQPLMADCNPVFENVSEDKIEVRLNKESATRNSINHDKRGQNVLFCDGHVEFLKTRHVGIPQDDIFTLQNIEVYRGTERPACRTDTFLAP
jgi:prepilin-type processing-associated H-X9-DG protein